MIDYHRIAGLFFNTPLAIEGRSADAIGAYLNARIAGETPPPVPVALDRSLDAAARDPAARAYRIDQGIAIIGISGELVNRGAWLGASSGLTSYDGIAAQVKAAASDAAVAGILLEINSPGGSVAGMAGLAQTISAVDKPVWAIANERAASAAYNIAAQASRIGVIPDGMVGSIGAFIVMRDMTRALDKAGVGATILRSHDRKARGNGIEAIDQPTIDRLQALVDEAGNNFVQSVAQRRGIDAQRIHDLKGEMLTASEALAAGLVDIIATVNDFHSAMVSAVRTPSAAAGRSKAVSAPRANPNVTKGRTMSDQPEITQANIDAARAEGRNEGATAERARISAILGCDEGKQRPKLAQHIALNTATSAADAQGLLAVAAVESPGAASNPLGAPQNLLNAAMKGVGNPKVDADIDAGGTAPKAAGEKETDAERDERQRAEMRASLGKTSDK